MLRRSPPRERDGILCRTLGGPQGQSRWMRNREKLLHLPRFEPRTIQPVASRYNAYAIPAPTPCIQIAHNIQDSTQRCICTKGDCGNGRSEKIVDYNMRVIICYLQPTLLQRRNQELWGWWDMSRAWCNLQVGEKPNHKYLFCKSVSLEDLRIECGEP